MANPSAISSTLTSNYNAVPVLPPLRDIRVVVSRGERKEKNKGEKKLDQYTLLLQKSV